MQPPVQLVEHVSAATLLPLSWFTTRFAAMAADPSVGGSANGSVTAGSGCGGVEVKRTQAFLVECGEVELKLTAKESA